MPSRDVQWNREESPKEHSAKQPSERRAGSGREKGPARSAIVPSDGEP